jgi:hypothetical protein
MRVSLPSLAVQLGVRPMLATYTSLAGRWYPWRWRFASVTAVMFLSMAALMFTRMPAAVSVAGLLAGPVICVSWGLVCMCVWFDPALGKLYSNGPIFRRLPYIVKAALRWYFAIFLTLWFLFGVIAWPAFAIWGMGLTARSSGP